MQSSRVFFLSFFISVFGIQSLKGSNRIDILQSDTLKEVEINSKKIRVDRSASPVQVISGSALEKSGSFSVADVTKRFSGVQVKDYGGIGGLKSVNVRSLGSQHTSVFYDGFQIGNAQNGQIDLGKFSLDNIEAIELYNGEKSGSLLPAVALGSAGSLYLQSRQPDFTNNHTFYRAAFKTGSFGLINPSAFLQFPVSGKISANVTGEYIKANGKYDFRYKNGPLDSLVTRQNSDIESYKFETGFTGSLKDSSVWTVKLFNYGSERGLPGAALPNKLSSSQRQWDNDFFLQTSFKKPVNERFQTMIRAKYGFNFSRYLDPEYLNMANRLDNKYYQHEWYLSWSNEYHWTSRFKTSLAADYIKNILSSNVQDSNYPIRNTGLVAFSSSYETQKLTLQASLLGSAIRQSSDDNRNLRDRNVLSPSFAFSFRPFAAHEFGIRGFYKDIFRMPTFNDLYYVFPETDLKPEFAKQYDLGFNYSKGLNGVFQFITFKADGYYNVVTDKIVAIPFGNLARWSMVNLGTVKIQGLDVGVNTSLNFNRDISLDATLNYTYQKALDMTPGGLNYKQYIPYAPRHSGNMFLGLTVKDFNLNYNYSYVGEHYNLRANISDNYMQPRYTHDVSVGKTFTGKKTNLKLLAEADNLLNLQYDVVRNFPMPGRSYRLTIAISNSKK